MNAYAKQMKVFKNLWKILLGIVLLAILIFILASTVWKDNTDYGDPVTSIRIYTNVTNEDATIIYDVFKSCGLNSFDKIVADSSLDGLDGDDSKGYRISAFGTNNIIMYLVNNKVYSIRYADKDYYKDNQVIRNFKDYTMTNEEQDTYMTLSQGAVKSILKSSSTAKFPSLYNWEFGKEDGIVKVHSYVDSQNSYGATVRAEFQATFDRNRNVTSLILDGMEYIK